MGSAPRPNPVINGMINDLVHDRANARKIVKEQGLPALLDAYKLTPEQKSAFKEANWQSFGSLGIAPVHQILLALQVSPQARAHLSWRAHEARFESEVRGPALAASEKEAAHG